MAKTANLAKSKGTKNDEFYTQYAAVPQLTSLFNYYSTGDEVLSIYDTPDSDGSGKITIQPYVAPVRMHAYTVQQTLAAPDEQLRADPVFNHEPPEILSANAKLAGKRQ